jgi:hypothetical protein
LIGGLHPIDPPIHTAQTAGMGGKLCSVTNRLLRLRLSQITSSSVNYKCRHRYSTLRPTRRSSAFGSSQNGMPAPVVAHERRVGRDGDCMRANDPRPKKDSDCRSGKVVLRDGLADCQDAEIVAFLACGHRPETTMTDETHHHDRRIDSRARASAPARRPPTRMRGWSG